MNSSTFFAVACAALFVLVFQDGGAAHDDVQDASRLVKRQSGPAGALNSDLKWFLLNTTRLVNGKISCTPVLTRTNYNVVPGVGAYRISEWTETWEMARRSCVYDGAQLAVIDSDQKKQLFLKWMRERGLQGLWLGFHDLFIEGYWVTVTGESMDSIGYNPWAPNEPNDGGFFGKQDCGVLWNYGVDDYGCNNMVPYICEINLCETLGPLPGSKNEPQITIAYH